MNKILKSLVSGFTSLSMCAVCMISIPATADEYENIETQATNRTLSVDFMGRGSTPNDASPGKAANRFLNMLSSTVPVHSAYAIISTNPHAELLLQCCRPCGKN